MVLFRMMKKFRPFSKPMKGVEWKLEVFKMWMYIYGPIITWYIFNTDYVQVHWIYPHLKTANYEEYKKLTLDYDDDED